MNNSIYLVQLITPLTTVLVALVGWFVVHRLSVWRDRVNHKRQLQTDFLIKAFQRLANSAHRPPSRSAEHVEEATSAFADIQLFGTRAQVRLLEEFAKQFTENGEASLDPLLNSLRQALRKELGYDQIDGNIRCMRFEDGSSMA